MNKYRLAFALLLVLSLGLVISGIAQQKPDDTATDPVCGMTVKKSEAKATFDYKGTTYYFCAVGCKDAFAQDPEKYLQKKETASPAKNCTCPKCGKEAQPQAVPCGRMMRQHEMGKQHQHGEMAGSAAGMNCPLHSKDVNMQTENLPDGAAVKFTSKNPDMVKKIQEHLGKMKACCCGGCCEPQEDIKK